MLSDIEAPLDHESERNSIRIRPFVGGVLYRRKTGEKEVRKRIYSRDHSLRFSPVKPFNLPKMVTSSLMIELNRSLMIAPGELKKAYLRFPVEIALIASKKGKDRVVDVFSENPPKYSMYGDIKEGILCRYYESGAHMGPPRIDQYKEGLLEVKIKNSTSDWREISILVFDGIMMKLFYSKDQVFSRARAKILDDEKVETSFSSRPFKKGQKKAFEMLNRSTFKSLVTRFTMEGGY